MGTGGSRSEAKATSLTAGQERSVKAIVAIACQLAVDMWRLFTGQTTAYEIGLIYLPEAA